MLEEKLDRRSPDCSVRESRQDGVPVVAVAGEVDMCTAPQLDAELTAQLERFPAALVVDLREVTFFDSSAINVLLLAQKRAANLRLVADRAVVLRPLHVTGLDTVFRIHPTLSEALEELAG